MIFLIPLVSRLLKIKVLFLYGKKTKFYKSKNFKNKSTKDIKENKKMNAKEYINKTLSLKPVLYSVSKGNEKR